MCVVEVIPTPATLLTTEPMSTAATSTVSSSVTTSVDMVSPVNLTVPVSNLSAVTPEVATVFTELTTAASHMTMQLTESTEAETSPLATTVSMATQTPTNSWGIQVSCG